MVLLASGELRNHDNSPLGEFFDVQANVILKEERMSARTKYTMTEVILVCLAL